MDESEWISNYYESDRKLAEANKHIKELQEANLKLEAKVRTLKIEQNYCLPNCSKIADLEKQIEKMKCCSNCDNWNWKHSKCEKKLKGDCFKASKWILRR